MSLQAGGLASFEVTWAALSHLEVLKFRGCELQAMPGSCLDTSLSLSYMPHQFCCFYFYEEGREIYPYPLPPSRFKPQQLLLDYCSSLLTFLASLLGISLLHHSQNVAVKTYSDHVTLLLPSASPSVKAKSLHLGHQGLTGLAQGFPTSTVLPLLHSPSWQWSSHWDLSIL